jgi:hypothetical protein
MYFFFTQPDGRRIRPLLPCTREVDDADRIDGGRTSSDCDSRIPQELCVTARHARTDWM